MDVGIASDTSDLHYDSSDKTAQRKVVFDSTSEEIDSHLEEIKVPMYCLNGEKQDRSDRRSKIVARDVLLQDEADEMDLLLKTGLWTPWIFTVP